MASTFLIGGIAQFVAVLIPLIVFIAIASTLSASFFLAPFSLIFWALAAIYTILLLISLAVMIIGVLFNLKIGEFVRGFLFGF